MTEAVRLDIWLWAARFFKTRTLASQAINGGKVRLNGGPAKAARPVKPGDEIEISKQGFHYQVRVLGVCDKRGPAPMAQGLYQESEESRRRREALLEHYRLVGARAPHPDHRPDKKARRQLRGLKR
jgi:ribosome-associated heat shock protein Hsp15